MSFLRKWGSTAAGSPAGAPVGLGEWHTSDKLEGERYFGMENVRPARAGTELTTQFGNTCYANSVLQALYFSKPFRALIQSYVPPEGAAPVPDPPPGPTPDARTLAGGSAPAPVSPSPTHAESTLLTTLHDLFVAISSQPRTAGTVAPQAFINQLKHDNEFFRSTLHQDAHEFLNYLINMIAEAVERDDTVRMASKRGEGKRRLGKEKEDDMKTWVHQLFEGVLTNETRCLTCETVTSRDEEFLDLSIDIEPNSSITACLRQFSASEMLRHRNKFHCDSCCGLQEAEKRMKIKRLPPILALHLKRFKYEESLQRHVKLNYRVVFPFELRLFNTADGIADPDRLYSLWAIVVHIGLGPHHGHYITLIKSSGRWISFDDNTVQPIEESDIAKYFGDTPGQGSGYVLFYQADDLDYSGLGLSVPEVAAALHGAAGMTPERQRDGLGLSMDVGAGPLSPASPVADVAHSFFARPADLQPFALPLPSLVPVSVSVAASAPPPVATSPSPAVPSPSTSPSLAPSPAFKEPVANGGSWGLKSSRSLGARLGRGLSMNAGAAPSVNGNGSARQALSVVIDPAPPVVEGKAVQASVAPAAPVAPLAAPTPVQDIPPPTRRPTSPSKVADDDASSLHSTATTSSLAPPLLAHSVSPKSQSHPSILDPHRLQQRPSSSGDSPAYGSSGGGRFTFLLSGRKRRGSNNASSPALVSVPSPSSAANGSGPARDAERRLSSAPGSPVVSSAEPRARLISESAQRKELERRVKEERKLWEKEEARKIKERKERDKEEAKWEKERRKSSKT